MISRRITPHRPGRRYLTAIAVFGLVAGSLVGSGSALAVHESSFQLDGDTTSTAWSPPPNSSPAFDWNDIFNVAQASGTETVSINSTNVGTGKTFDAASFVRDFETNATCPTTSAIGLSSTSTIFCTADDTTYATGSKDTLGVGNGGWQCNHDNNVNSKIDITNAYVLQFTAANSHKIFYFGVERNVSNGTNDVGVWFLQSEAKCSAPTGHLNFTGHHRDGDTLVVAEQTSGGGVSTAKAFRWAASTDSTSPFYNDGGCLDSNDNFNPAVVVNGTHGCNNLPIGTGGDCKSGGGGDAICATTNANCPPPRRGTDVPPCTLPWNQSVTTNWLTANGSTVGHTVVSPDFFEGGIDITAAFSGHPGTTPSCFTTTVPDTRSSASPTATLFDFTLNQFGGCGGSLSTQENAAASREIGANGTISSGTDTAKLKITGSSIWGGTLTWYLCGPNVTSCNNQGYTDNTLTTPVASTDGGTGAAAEKTYTSGSTTLTAAGVGAAGQYCWHAHFEPNQASKDAGIDPQDDGGANECFSVTPKTPTLATAAVASASGLSPTIYGHLADVNGSGTVTSADDANVFYGDTSIIDGALDCNNWGATPNAGTAGDGVINASDACTLIGYDGTSDGVTIVVSNSGQFTTADGINIANGTPLPTVFNATSPNDPSVVNAQFAWSTILGRVDANGNGTITGDDCSINVVGTYDILGSVCQGYTIPQGNGLVDLNDDGKITTADACTNGCFLGHNVSVGYVLAGSVTLGSTLYDFASLTGTANNPDPLNPGTNLTYPTINGGTKPADSIITWTLYGPASDGSASCASQQLIAGAPTGSPANVSGDGQYGPVSYVTNHAGDKAGKYTFAATYAGDGPNTLGATDVGCDATGANGEQITVIGTASSSSAQRWLPNDRVVLSSTAGTTLNGTLTVTLYKGVFGGSASSCTLGTGVAVTGQSYSFTVTNGAASGASFNTTNTDPATSPNTTFYVGTNPDGTTTGAGTAGTYFWLIHYVDNSLTSPTDRCETSTLSPITD